MTKRLHNLTYLFLQVQFHIALLFLFSGSISGHIPFSARTIGFTAGAAGVGSRATWDGIALLNNPVSFFSLSNWICKPEIKFNRSSALSFVFAVMSLILFRRRTIARSSGECSRSCRCWRRSSLPALSKCFCKNYSLFLRISLDIISPSLYIRTWAKRWAIIE